MTTWLLMIIWCLSSSTTSATKPPGYVEPEKPFDAHAPNYAYTYAIQSAYGSNDQGAQGHMEQREGELTKGNYFVQLPNGQAHSDVQYTADDWGYHPIFR